MGSLYGRLHRMAKRHRGALIVVVAAAFVLGGCATAPQTPAPKDIDEMSPPEILYQAIISTYQSREMPIALSSEEFLVVTSEYTNVGPNLRRRMASRVVRASRGAMGLKVTTEWERRTRIDGEERWQPIDTDELRRRGKAEELDLARAIEKRFESWKEQWKASKKSAKETATP